MLAMTPAVVSADPYEVATTVARSFFQSPSRREGAPVLRWTRGWGIASRAQRTDWAYDARWELTTSRALAPMSLSQANFRSRCQQIDVRVTTTFPSKYIGKCC